MDLIEAATASERILKPVLAKHRFKAQALAHGHEQWGDWAAIVFVRSSLLPFGARRLTLHFQQQQLARVDYEIGKCKIDHARFAAALGAAARYPRRERDALTDVEDLAADLAAFGESFLSGPARRFRQIAQQ